MCAKLGLVPTFVIGDLHGQIEAFVHLLRSVGLVDVSRRWTGEDATLVLLGDFVDRGPHGVACIELAMGLEAEAQARGGRVLTLMGNHDLVLLAAYAFPDFGGALGITFYQNWLQCGGVEADMEALSWEHARWLRARPAMALLSDTLFVHGDSEVYLDHGRSLKAVNASVKRVLAAADIAALDRFLDGFGQHSAFEGKRGAALLEQFLGCYGGERLVHGHTPISSITGVPPESVSEPRVYHQGRCINVDGGLYLGGVGFIHQLD